MKRAFYVLLPVLVLGLLLVGKTSALSFSTEKRVSFTFNSMISLNLSSPELIIPNLAPGNAADSNIIRVGVSTNSSTGYTLNATVGQETNFETRNLILSGSEANFASLAFGSSVANISSDNTWGFSYKPANDSNWTNYSGLPQYDNPEDVATLINTTEASDNNYVLFKIGARASSMQPSGEYRNVINFIAVANPQPELGPVPCEPGAICYNMNALDNYEGTMAKQYEDDEGNPLQGGSTVTLRASNFSHEGHGFAGWSTSYDYDDPSAEYYGPNQTITVTPEIDTEGLSLYAIWIPSAGTMQSDGAGICSALPSIDPNIDYSSRPDLNYYITALTDERDGQTYAIAKISETSEDAGACWMLENLRLDNTAIGNMDGSLAQGYWTTGSVGYFAGLASPENAGAFVQSPGYGAVDNSLYSLVNSQGKIFLSNNIYDTPPYVRMPRYNNQNTANRDEDADGTGNTYSYGNYYTWHAALADPSLRSIDAHFDGTSICPNGWRLPFGGPMNAGASVPVYRHEQTLYTITPKNTSSYVLGGVLVNGYAGGAQGTYDGAVRSVRGLTASETFRSFPYNFVYSGTIENGAILHRGSLASITTATSARKQSDISEYYHISIGGDTLYSGSGTNDRLKGGSVRCVIER